MTKIDKRAARKLYENGTEFWITACNMRPECGLLITSEYKFNYPTFDALDNSFRYYNCSNETGRYPAYYTAE